MSKQPHRPAQAEAPSGKLPGERLTSAEEMSAQSETLAMIKGELDAERKRNEAFDKQKAAELAGSNVKLAQLDETAEQRAESHRDTVSLVTQEMAEQYAQNPPRLQPQGLDQASLDLIKAEMSKTHKRVVLPAG